VAIATYLLDKSALARAHLPRVSNVLTPLLDAGLLALCGVSHLELLYSARNVADYLRTRADLDGLYEWLNTEDTDFRRAIDVQESLARSGQHRGVTLPDLLIAAVAERHRVSVLHYDADFDLIGEHTGQPTQWVLPSGSIHAGPD